MDNDDNNGMPLDGGNDYGNEDYDGQPNDDGGNNPDGGNQDGDVDQYFDDAGDIGYLPADHVTSAPFLTAIAFDATFAKCLDKAVD